MSKCEIHQHYDAGNVDNRLYVVGITPTLNLKAKINYKAYEKSIGNALKETAKKLKIATHDITLPKYITSRLDFKWREESDPKTGSSFYYFKNGSLAVKVQGAWKAFLGKNAVSSLLEFKTLIEAKRFIEYDYLEKVAKRKKKS